VTSNIKQRTGFPLTVSDVRGLTRAGFDAVVGVTDLVEAVHLTIGQRAGIVGPPVHGRTAGLTGIVYKMIRGTTRTYGRGFDLVLALFGEGAEWQSTPERDAALAVINGVWGDHLAASANPLAIPMTFRIGGRPLDLERGTLSAQVAQPHGRLLIMVHGLCMNDRQWRRRGHDHGAAGAALGYTPIYLRYNSGRHISENGREFAYGLEALVDRWPVPVREIVIIGHSMGGLLARSACHFATAMGHRWPAALRNLIFLGTPHHGAVLERGGHLLDRALGISPYMVPFLRLGRTRSAGITDLRFGNLQDADWKGRGAHEQPSDDRRPTPLPAGVASYVIAGTIGESTRRLQRAVLGDGLVPLDSALGDHADPAHHLKVPLSNRCIVSGAHHFDLLDHALVRAQLVAWLRRSPGRAARPGNSSR
jgi:pimeloyl-ACP methyl ester carboxylesterase